MKRTTDIPLNYAFHKVHILCVWEIKFETEKVG